MATMRGLILKEMIYWNESWEDVEAVEIDFQPLESGYWKQQFKKCDCAANAYPLDKNNSDTPIQSLTTDGLLDLEFDDGFGSECPFHPIVWTKNHIYYHHEYDGSDSIRCLPRYPKEQQ